MTTRFRAPAEPAAAGRLPVAAFAHILMIVGSVLHDLGASAIVAENEKLRRQLAAADDDEHQGDEPADICLACGRVAWTIGEPPCDECSDAPAAGELGELAARVDRVSSNTTYPVGNVGEPGAVDEFRSPTARLLSALRGRGAVVDDLRRDEAADELGELAAVDDDGEHRGEILTGPHSLNSGSES